ncbi:MAG: hypothetical protein ABIH42_10860, partial [Planctomycetota bacterium]
LYCNASAPTLTNCVFENNTGTNVGGGGLRSDTSAVTEIYNSIIWCNTAAGNGNQLYKGTGTLTLDKSDVSNEVGDIFGIVTQNNCINVDPLFVDKPNSDYHLQTTSVCIDYGDNGYVPTGVDVDLYGKPRIINLIVDLGCYEYGLAADTTPPITTHTLSGTEGNDPWWISDVAVTLTAENKKYFASIT